MGNLLQSLFRSNEDLSDEDIEPRLQGISTPNFSTLSFNPSPQTFQPWTFQQRTTDAQLFFSKNSKYFGRLGRPAEFFFQYSGRTVTSTETNHSSKESSDTWFFWAASRRTWQYQEIFSTKIIFGVWFLAAKN